MTEEQLRLFRRWTIIFLYVPRLRAPSDSGPLFRATRGNTVLSDVFSTDAAEARLKSYLEAVDSPTRPFTVFAAVGPLPWHLLEALWTTSWNI